MYRDDSELIRACLSDDETAWRELVERYARLVYSIPLRRGMSAADADEIFQNVFTIVFRQLQNLRNERSLVAWLMRITHNECHRLLKGSLPDEEIDDSFPDTGTPPLEEVEIWEKQHLVRLALNQLEPRCQDLLTALFLESPPPSYEELAERLKIPVGSIGPTRTRCFKKLEEILIEMGFDDAG